MEELNNQLPNVNNSNVEANQKSPKQQSTLQYLFSFKGRINRLEYFCVYVVSCIYSFIGGMLSEDSEIANIIYLIFFIPFCWYIIAANTKRCHDFGFNGWWQLVPLWGIVLLFMKGDAEANEYGDVP